LQEGWLAGNWLAGRLAAGDWLSGRLFVNKTKLICWQFGWLQVMAGTNIG
jgi:hypothetical protein